MKYGYLVPELVGCVAVVFYGHVIFSSFAASFCCMMLAMGTGQGCWMSLHWLLAGGTLAWLNRTWFTQLFPFLPYKNELACWTGSTRQQL